MVHITGHRVGFFVNCCGVASEKDFFGRGTEDAHLLGLVVAVGETHVWLSSTVELIWKWRDIYFGENYLFGIWRFKLSHQLLAWYVYLSKQHVIRQPTCKATRGGPQAGNVQDRTSACTVLGDLPWTRCQKYSSTVEGRKERKCLIALFQYALNDTSSCSANINLFAAPYLSHLYSNDNRPTWARVAHTSLFLNTLISPSSWKNRTRTSFSRTLIFLKKSRWQGVSSGSLRNFALSSIETRVASYLSWCNLLYDKISIKWVFV